jgi:hypothetical protein
MPQVARNTMRGGAAWPFTSRIAGIRMVEP